MNTDFGETSEVLVIHIRVGTRASMSMVAKMDTGVIQRPQFEWKISIVLDMKANSWK